MESGILALGIRNTAVGIRNPTNDWNPESKFHYKIWKLITGIRNPRRGFRNPRLSSIPLHGATYLFSVEPRSTDTRLITTPVYDGQLCFLILPGLIRTPVTWDWQRTLLCPVSQTRIVNPVWWTLVTCVHLYYLPRDNYVHVCPFQVMMDFYGIIRFCCIQNKTVQTNKNNKTSTK